VDTEARKCYIYHLVKAVRTTSIMRLKTKPLSDFITSTTLDQGSQVLDSLFVFDKKPRMALGNLDGTVDKPFVIHLNHAILIPEKSAAPLPDRVRKKQVIPPRPLRYKRGNLLLTSGKDLFSESLTRNAIIPDCLSYIDGKFWTAKLPAIEHRINEDCLFIELIGRSFGHSLLDMPARLWPLLEPMFEPLQKLKPVSFGSHGIGMNYKIWPKFVHMLLDGLNLRPADIEIINQPTEISSLYVPRRITPLGTNHDAPPFYDLLQSMGAKLIANYIAPTTPRSRIYLSRSRLDEASRGLEDNRELEIEKIFLDLGFEIVHPQLLSLEEQIYNIRHADLIAGCAGSALHIAVFRAKPGLHLLRVAPAFHNPPWDSKILAASQGESIDFTISAESGARQINKAKWSISDAQLRDLATFATAWVGGVKP